MADVVVSAVVNKTVDIAANLIINEGSRLYWLSEDIKWLESQLRHMQSYLEDAEAQKVNNPKVENLLKDIRNLAYDAEDILDTFLSKIELHRTLGLMKRAAKILPYSRTCTRFAREIEKIKRRVEGIDADRKIYGIECTGPSGGVEGTSGGKVDPRSTELHFDEPIVVGFDKYIEELKMKLLSHEEEEHLVVSIVGMGGLGKTTLAKKVFRFVRDHFDCSASVSVSQDPNVKSLLQDIAKQVGMEEEKRREENIKASLCSFLEMKRYVFFLDDIWSTETWDSLKEGFSFASGSRIIITSRDNGVGRYISGRDSLLHQLLPFDFLTSWELFSKSLVPSLGITNLRLDNSDLGDIGKKIVERCGGVPLSIAVTVGILRERGMSEMAWSAVLKSMGQDAHDKCSKILALSYEDLPTPLKPCFLYLGLFPEDYEMKACHVIRMWMAENFIQGCIGELEPEDVGDDYLNKLDARNLIQVIRRKYDGRINTFRIHDLLHDLCVNVGKEINFLHTTIDNDESRSGLNRIRRLAIQNLDIIDSLVTSNVEAHKVRTLLIFDKKKQISKKRVEEILARFKLLRVFSLEVDLRYAKEKAEMKILNGLKYLKMKGLKSIELTPSVKMQTLDIGSVLGIGLPFSIWKIKTLRHAILGYSEGKRRFKFLRTIKTNELCLPNLQTLEVFFYYPLERSSWLSKFNNLRKLYVFNIDNEKIDVLSGGSEPISKKLETLCLRSKNYYLEACTSVFDLSKYEKLMKLTLQFRMQQFPQSHECFPPNIVKLKLRFTFLREDPMQVLKKLAKLKILILGPWSYMGTTLDYSGLDSFPRLQFLQLEWLDNLVELVDGDQGMSPPNLRQVIITGCRELVRIPEALMPFVTRIEIAGIQLNPPQWPESS